MPAPLPRCLPHVRVCPRGGLRSLSLLLLIAVTWASARAATSPTTPPPALTKSWPQWRGPLANGIAPEAHPPTNWSETQNLRWKVPLPGKAHASPIVHGSYVYLTAAVPVGDAQKPVYDHAPGTHDNVPVTHRHQFVVLAVDRGDGRVAWQKVLREEFPHEGGHATGSLASNSPVTDGERLYVFFGSHGLFCLDLQGVVLWEKSLGRMQTLHAHGEGSSPVVYGDLLIVCWDHEGDSFLYAFDKRTGKCAGKRPVTKRPRGPRRSWWNSKAAPNSW